MPIDAKTPQHQNMPCRAVKPLQDQSANTMPTREVWFPYGEKCGFCAIFS
jgi:hypothetical protein